MKRIFTTLALGVMMMTTALAQSFITQTNYRGAFDQSSVSGANWLAGWTELAPKSKAYPGFTFASTANATSTSTTSSGEAAGTQTSGFAYGATDGSVPVAYHITSNTTWNSNTVYYIYTQVFVDAGVTLTIQPGTIVRGVPQPSGNFPSYLAISQGGKIVAQGTSSNPIVMTSAQTPANRATGDWGGLVLCGKARTNLSKVQYPAVTGTGYFAGKTFPAGGRPFEVAASEYGLFYGGYADDNDNSGTVQYVRVEFAGDAIAQDKEFNGFTLCGVGDGTTIDHVQVSYANDDSFEWFGGAVNMKYLFALGGIDDDFDMDEGFRGKLQFGLGMRDAGWCDRSDANANTITANSIKGGTNNSNGFEIDDNTAGPGTPGAGHNSSNYTAAPFPLTAPTIANFTMVGPLQPGWVGGRVNRAFGYGARFRTNAAPSIFNTIWIGWKQVLNLSTRNNIAGITYSNGTGNNNGANNQPSSMNKFGCDSSTVKNCAILVDKGTGTNNGINPSIFNLSNEAFGQYGCTASNTSPFEPGTVAGVVDFLGGTTRQGVTAHNLLTARGNIYDSTSVWDATAIGINNPFSSAADTVFGTFANFTGVDLTLAVDPAVTTKPVKGGAWPTDARASATQSLVISNTQTTASGTYDKITITGTGNATFGSGVRVNKNVIVQNGGQLTVNAFNGFGTVTAQGGSTVTLNAAVPTANALVLDDASSVKYTPTGAVSLSAASAGNLEFASGGANTLSSALQVNGILKLTNGSLAAGSSLLTIGSSATRQGIIDDFTGTGTISGTIKFNRYTSGNYRQLAAPVSGVTEDQYVATYGANTLKQFNEAGNNWTNAGETSLDPSPQLSSRLVAVVGQTKTVTFTGTVSNGTKTATLARTAPVLGITKGWNGLGNPYTSPMRWSLVKNIAGNTTASNLTAYVWNSSINNYGTITSTGTLTNGANDVIAPGQGFLVRAATNGATFTLNSTVRVSSSTNTFIREGNNESPSEVIRMTFATSKGADEVWVNTNNESAAKFFSPIAEAPALYIKGDEALTIAPVAAVNADTRIALGIKGEGVLTVTNLNVPAGLTAYVMNSRTGSIQAINNGSTVKASENDNLSVVFRNSIAEKFTSVYAYAHATGIRVVMAGNDNGSTIEVVDAAGKVVSRTPTAAGVAEATIATPLMPGVYQIRVSGSTQGITRVAAGF